MPPPRPRPRTMPRSHALPLLLTLALLGGCAAHLPSVGPDYQPPELPMPKAWSIDIADAVPPPATRQTLTNWWRQFDDPLLDRLIEIALADGLDLRLAQARLRQARAGRALAEAEPLPVLSASTGASRNNGAAAPSRTTYDAGFDAVWEIDIFGGSRRAIEAAAADQQAAEAKLGQARISLLAEVARNYVEFRSYQQRLAIARNHLASQEETAQITQWRYQAGLAAAGDVEQARTSREQTRATLPDLQIGLAAAENRLATLLGRNPGELPAELAEPRALPAVPPTMAADIPAAVLRQRPDLIAAERTLAAETARIGQKQAQRFPSLNLNGSFGWQAYRYTALGGGDTLVRALGGALAATLFDGGRLRNTVEIQNAVQEQALLAYRNSVLTALEEVENALQTHAAGHERLAARRAAAAAAREAAQLTQQLYQSGLADFQKVLETERTRLSAEDSLATAEAALRTSLIGLYKALGGGWQPLPALPQDAPTS